MVRRQGGTCLSVDGTANYSYLYSACITAQSKNVWEIFPTTVSADPVIKSYVLKSMGAFKSWNQHKCLTFDGTFGAGRPQVGACNTSNSVDMIYR
jgi:hypothetical protein